MNIFYLSTDPYTAARAMTNAHVCKMIVETAQLLSTAHLILDGEPSAELSKSGRKQNQYRHPNSDILYKITHVNHPSAVWARQNISNYSWLYLHFLALCEQYTDRYSRVHLTQSKLVNVLMHTPKSIPISPITSMPQAMPEQYKDPDSVVAYRRYYEAEKLKLPVDIERYHRILEI